MSSRFDTDRSTLRRATPLSIAAWATASGT
jgi:hypothetical protein